MKKNVKFWTVNKRISYSQPKFFGWVVKTAFYESRGTLRVSNKNSNVNMITPNWQNPEKYYSLYNEVMVFLS